MIEDDKNILLSEGRQKQLKQHKNCRTSVMWNNGKENCISIFMLEGCRILGKRWLSQCTKLHPTSMWKSKYHREVIPSSLKLVTKTVWMAH